MQWKRTDGDEVEESEQTDPYYEDDGYATFQEEGTQKTGFLSGNPVRILYWGLGIAVIAGVVLLVMLLFSNINESADLARIRELEETVHQLQQQVDKYAAMDEKVTHMAEQAKAFETFKTRFDRSEASMSLRMDHLAMSLDALQKKNDETLKKVTTFDKKPAPKAKKKASVTPPKKKESGQAFHTVVSGDTLFNISQRYKMTVPKLMELNGLADGAVIHVGQKLKVSGPAATKKK